MQRVLSVLLMVVGLALAVVGLVRFFERPAHVGARPVVVAPAAYSRYLTPGVWVVYGQSATGPFGTPLLFGTSVVGPRGGHLTLSPPSFVNTLRTGGLSYTESTSVLVTAAGDYQIDLTPPVGVRLHTVLVRATHPALPWGILAIDGFVVLAIGSVWTVLDDRRRKQMAVLETMYSSDDPRPSGVAEVVVPVS